jgi:arginine exporter protein ArgO
MIMKRHPHLHTEEPIANPQRRWRVRVTALGTAFALTIINPATLLAFLGVFAGLGLFPEQPHRLLRAWIVIAGAFAGSMLWWATLTGTASAVRRHLSLNLVVGLNIVLGVLVAGLGAASLLSVFGVET